MKQNIRLFVLFLTLAASSCTKLDEKFRSELEQNNSGSITPDQLLTSAYNALSQPFQGNGNLWASQEISSDEAHLMNYWLHSFLLPTSFSSTHLRSKPQKQDLSGHCLCIGC